VNESRDLEENEERIEVKIWDLGQIFGLKLFGIGTNLIRERFDWREGGCHLIGTDVNFEDKEEKKRSMEKSYLKQRERYIYPSPIL
jgi:hypothetical protein